MPRNTTQTQPPVLSAGVIVVRFIERLPHYLLLRVYNYWDFPKGLVEENESPLEAAKREVKEETTLTCLIFRWGEAYRETEPYRYRLNKIARYYVAESPDGKVSLPVNPELKRPEHHQFQWLPFEKARLLLSARVQPILEWANDLIERQERQPD